MSLHPEYSMAAVRAALVGLIAAAAAVAATIDDLQYEGRVVVTADGNGMAGARFPTTVEGDGVKYYLDVQNGCSGAFDLAGTEPCPPPVKAMNVTLNGEVVFQKASFTTERVEIALHLAGTTDNQISVSADGERGAAARFAVIAVRPTPPISAKK